MPDVPQEPEVVVTIQRYDFCDDHGTDTSDDGPIVFYADHVEALRQAEQRGRDGVASIATEALRQWYEQGQRDALAGAIQRVSDVKWPPQTWQLHREVLAAIKGNSDE